MWKHVKSPRAYKIAKKHKKLRGKKLLQLRLLYKKLYKRRRKIGKQITLLEKEKSAYPQRAIVRISDFTTYFYDLQKNIIAKTQKYI